MFVFYILSFAIKYMYMACIGSGQVSNQYFSSILFSIHPSLPTVLSFTDYSVGASSFHTQSLKSDSLSYLLCTFLSFY